MSLASLNNFCDWFTSNGGTVDPTLIGFHIFPEFSRGVITLKDIDEGTTLFTLPRSLTISTRTSELPALLGGTWKEYTLHKGWVGLILCMLWESAKGVDGKWYGYFNSLPETFDTPMFWSEEELKLLEGTAVIDKIGKENAEQDYYKKLLPAVKSRPDIFRPERIDDDYSLEMYHRMGSRILSRSFHVEPWDNADGRSEDENNVDGENENDHRIPKPEAMEVDHPSHDKQDEVDMDDTSKSDTSDSSEDSESEDPRDIAMVPFADLLNARFGCENAKLFYEEGNLGMITTKLIATGKQIWNTYGDPPNSDLLRRYGHVDILDMEDGTEGNTADIVEIRADLVVKACRCSEEDAKERIDWWLDEGGDDVFMCDTTLDAPDALISFIKLLTMTPTEWETARQKGKPPKPKLDSKTREVLIDVMTRRMVSYPTTLEQDKLSLESLLTSEYHESRSIHRKKCALYVCIGEKKILAGVLDRMKNSSLQKYKRDQSSISVDEDKRRQKKRKY